MRLPLAVWRTTSMRPRTITATASVRSPRLQSTWPRVSATRRDARMSAASDSEPSGASQGTAVSVALSFVIPISKV